MRAYDKRIGDLLAAHPDTPILTSFPGVGPIVAATLISEIGEDRARFPAPGTLLAETGLAPVTRASGRTRQVRFRYAANRRMRHAIDWWMFVATREDDWSRTIYEQARAAAKASTEPCAASAPAGHASFGAAGPTTPPTTPPATTRSRPPRRTNPSGPAPARSSGPSPCPHNQHQPQDQLTYSGRGLTAGVCLIHLLRNSFKYASRAHWAQISKDLKPVYTAPSEQAALDAFAEFSTTWEAKYPAIVRLWTNAWPEFVPFLAFDTEIRKIVCSTNAIESLNARFRRAVNARGHFPNEQAALECLYLVTRSLDPTGKAAPAGPTAG